MNIKFLLDENMPFALLEYLKNKGYEVKHLKKVDKVGIKNGEVYKFAEKIGSWILTRDSDFKSYHKFICHDVKGIIVFALKDTRTINVLKVIERFLESHIEKLSSKNLIIIEDSGIRIYGAE
jgi:predicted nuclease of predicted toxin-antitoxin system